MESSNFFKMNEQCLLLSVKITAWLVVVKEGSDILILKFSNMQVLDTSCMSYRVCEGTLLAPTFYVRFESF